MCPFHVAPNVRDMPPVPQNRFPLYFAPFFALLGMLGLALVLYELPAILLLFAGEEGSALSLLRAYWTGYTVYSVLAALSPLPFLGLTWLLYWLTARKLDREIRSQSRSAPLILMPFILPAIGILMWSALAPGGTCAFCEEIAADIRQIEGENLESITVLLDERSAPDTTFRDNPEGWQVSQRIVLGPDTNFEWVTLRFPDTLNFTPVPDSFVVIGGTCDWNWEHAQRYQVRCTSNFRLVTEITPVD